MLQVILNCDQFLQILEYDGKVETESDSPKSTKRHRMVNNVLFSTVTTWTDIFLTYQADFDTMFN